ncbi:hypothetical protein AOQ88_01950 [Candidatus Riesia sp. GBBU]|nr:hypothetical protein AOQ88_01950 [Candidatus Riesia sp. GBBU]
MIINFFSKHLLLCTTWIMLFLLVVTLTISSFFSKIENITRTKAIQLINRNKAVVVDLRNRSKFYSGHIIFSMNFTPEEIENKKIEGLIKYINNPVVVVSENGIESFHSAKKLSQYGFNQVYILKEGINGWLNNELPLTKKNIIL